MSPSKTTRNPSWPVVKYASAIATAAGDDKEDPWLLPQWIPLNYFTLFSGLAGTGKTMVALNLAAAVTTGTAWPIGPGIATEGKVAVFNGEDGLSDRRANQVIIPRLLAAHADLHRVIVTMPKDKKSLRDAEYVDDLANWLLHYEVTLLIVDPLRVISSGFDLMGEDAYAFIDVLDNIAERAGCTIIGILHDNKNQDQADGLRTSGSYQLHARSRAVLRFVNLKAESEEFRTRGRPPKRTVCPYADNEFEMRWSKVNMGEKQPPVRFIVEKDVEDETRPVIRWSSASPTINLTLSAEDDFEADSEDDSEVLYGCDADLYQLLAAVGGSMRGTEVIAAMTTLGYKEWEVRSSQKKVARFEHVKVPGRQGRGYVNWVLGDGKGGVK